MTRTIFAAALAALIALPAAALEPGGSAAVKPECWHVPGAPLGDRIVRLKYKQDLATGRAWVLTLPNGRQSRLLERCLIDLQPYTPPPPTGAQCRSAALTAYRAALARCGA